jgi:Leucine-rich repeat (LRR) protein
MRLPEEQPSLGIDEAQVRPLLEGLRRLFPDREEQTLRQYAQAIASTPRRDVWNHYADLARQVSTLRTSLDAWSHAGDAAQRAAGADRGVRVHWSASRAIMAQEILQAWHPQLPGETPTFQLDLDGALTGGVPPFPHTVGWGRLSGLTLRNTSATELPPFTAQHFAGLRSLRLINTALEALPQWLLNLEHLTHVSVRGNRLAALPAQLSRMARLSSLDLGHNRLTVIPQVLGQLGELRTLNLESNGIVIDAQNAARLESMQQLEVLILDGNPLASMPSLVRSIELRRVTLRNTQLQAFPTELLGQHPGMSLALEGNRIVELDEESLRLIARDRARICLDYNPLSQASVQRLDANDRLEPMDPFAPQEGDQMLADDPQRVQALRAILIRIGNQVTNASARLPQQEVLAAHLNVLEQASTLRESLEQWCGDDPNRLAFARRLLASWLPEVPGSVSPPHERHFALRIDGAQIGALPQFPDTISWGRLRWLRLVNIDFSSVAPDYFSRFTNLIQLRINNCHLSEIPAWVCDLRRLDDLSLSNNQLVSLPEGLERLTELTTLFLNDNRLTQVPDALRGLGRLQQLGLANNQIVVDVGGAARLNALSALRMLDLNNNPLGSLPTLPQSTSLERVAVANCQLSEFPLAFMREHPNVTLRLDGNRISELSEEAVRLIRANPQGVNLQLNPLSEDSARRLAAVQPALEPAQPPQPEPQLQAQAARAPERVVVRMANPQAQHHGVDASRDRWLQGLPSPLQQQRQAQWARLTAEPGVEDWLTFLEGLSRTADFQQDVEAIQARVWSLIDACELNARVRGAIFDEAQRDGMAESYLAQLDRLEFARVRALRTEGLLGDDLERAYVQLAREQLSLLQEGRPEALIEALAGSRYWQDYLHQRFTERFDARLLDFTARVDALDALAINPNEYMQRIAVLAAERNAVFHTLIRELTVEACMRHPAQEH